MEMEKMQNTQNNLEQEEQRWKAHSSWFQKLLQSSAVIKTVWYWHEDRNWESRNKPHIYGELILDKSVKIIQKERIVFASKGIKTTSNPHAKGWIGLLPYYI